MKQAFEYINQNYRLNIKKNDPVVEESTGRKGTIAKAQGAYIFILWEGVSRPMGPYHPTSDLKYPNP